VSARNLIDETDGLEIVLQGGQSIVNRTDTEVTVETWLISTEIALAQNDISSAQSYFEKAIVRLSSEEAELRRKRVSFFERRKLEQYYHDLGQMLKLYGLTLGLMSGDGEARKSLVELCETVRLENDAAIDSKKLPNVPLHSRLLCLLGEINNNNLNGIPAEEARRWIMFGSPEINKSNAPVAPETLPEKVESAANNSALVSIPNSDLSVKELLDTSSNEALLNITLMLMERMSNSLNKVEQTLPDFMNFLRGESITDSGHYEQRQFGGHLLDADLFALLHNAYKLDFTGIIKFEWHKDLFKNAILKGYLPEIVRVGEASLYAAEGFIIDAVFKGQSNVNTLETAQENFLLLTRMCLSIQTDDTDPNILSKALWEPAVAERPRLLKIRENSLVNIAADLDEAVAGVQKDEGEMSFFDSQANQTATAEIEVEKPDESLFSNNHVKEEKPRSDEQTASEEEDDEDVLDLT
jgi:hypothetical protein